jgi:hypothetical protein
MFQVAHCKVLSNKQAPTKWISCLFLCIWLHPAFAAAENPRPVQSLTLEETVRRVLDHNESVQMRMLDMEISRRVLRAEKGIFEPAVVSSVDHIDNRPPNNIREQRTLLTEELIERNTIYNGGLEFLSPIPLNSKCSRPNLVWP